MLGKSDSIKPQSIIKHDTGTNDFRINTEVKNQMSSMINNIEEKNLIDKGECKNGNEWECEQCRRG